MRVTTHVYESASLRTLRDEHGPAIIARDVVDALGLTNTTYTTRNVPEDQKRLVSIQNDGRPPARTLVITPAGLVTLLSTKPTAAAAALLAWAEETLFPAIVDDLDEQPPIVKAALPGIRVADAPWAGIALQYEGQTLYEDPDSRTLWATQRQIAGVYGCSIRNVSKHLQAIGEEGFLDPVKFTRIEFTVLHEGDHEVTRKLVFYGFQAICAVGDRVSSEKGAAFRAWRANWLETSLTGEDDLAALRAENCDLKQALRMEQDRSTKLVAFADETEWLGQDFESLRMDIREIQDNRRKESCLLHVWRCRLDEGLNPFTGEPLMNADHLEVMAKYRRHLATIARVIELGEIMINDTSCLIARPQGIVRYAKKPPTDSALVPATPSQAVPTHAGPTDALAAVVKRDTDEFDQPESDEERAARRERILEYHRVSLDREMADKYRRRIAFLRAPYSPFRTTTLRFEHKSVATTLDIFDADLALDPLRWGASIEDLRILIDARIGRGRIVVVDTNTPEVQKDWAAWVAQTPARRAGVIVDFETDPKKRKARDERRAAIIADDGESRH